jgi:hypothetical protein
MEVKLFKQNNARHNETSQKKTGMIEFRVRCIQPLCHLSNAMKYNKQSPKFLNREVREG